MESIHGNDVYSITALYMLNSSWCWSLWKKTVLRSKAEVVKRCSVHQKSCSCFTLQPLHLYKKKKGLKALNFFSSSSHLQSKYAWGCLLPLPLPWDFFSMKEIAGSGSSTVSGFGWGIFETILLIPGSSKLRKVSWRWECCVPIHRRVLWTCVHVFVSFRLFRNLLLQINFCIRI